MNADKFHSAVILGGTGFLGAHLARLLLKEGVRVRIFHRPGSDTSRIADIAGQVERCTGDLTDPDDLVRAVEGMERVFHLVSATVPSSGDLDPTHDLSVNVMGTVRLLDACVRARVGKVIYVSSGGTVYGRTRQTPIAEDHPLDPLYAYGIGKVACEHYFGLYQRIHGLDHAILRVANAYGEGYRLDRQQGVIGIWLHHLLLGRPVEVWGDGSIERDYVHVDDVARALAMAARTNTTDHVFNIGSGTGTSLRALGTLMERTTGRHLDVVYREARSHDAPVSVLDISRARRDLGWEPRVPLEEGVRRAWQWVMEHTAVPRKAEL